MNTAPQNEFLSNDKSRLPLFSRKLITLLWMTEFLAFKIVNITSHINRFVSFSEEIFGGEWTSKDRDEIAASLKSIGDDLDLLSLSQTRILSDRIAGEVKALPVNEAKTRAYCLRERFCDDLESKAFLKVDEEHLGYYQKSNIAGQAFESNFIKTANVELTEAGNCLALNRPTACVCHIMRAFDIVLSRLEISLGMTPPLDGPERTWGKTLKRVGSVIDANNTNPQPNWDGDFYDKARVFLWGVKRLRDDTFHVKAVYDEETATSIFKSSVEAFRHLGAKLRE